VICKLVFKLKKNPDGSILKYKVQLVARGFIQRKGLNYEDTFTLMAKMTSTQILLVIAAHQELQILSIDINNTYLHGEIDVEVYMTQPLGYIDPRYPNHVCKLLKGLYGLKQTG
jgi:Reverse transcriptase (RNA-dependent DNA polymerase)